MGGVRTCHRVKEGTEREIGTRIEVDGERGGVGVEWFSDNEIEVKGEGWDKPGPPTRDREK